MSEARDAALTETLLEEGWAYRGGYLQVRKDRVQRADGVEAWREVVVHRGAVAIVALDAQGRCVLVRQHRHAVGGLRWELPAGVLDRNAEDPEACARRELAEECGLEGGQWRALGQLEASPGYTTERCHLFLAEGLRPRPGGKLEADDLVHAEAFPLEEAIAMALDGRIVDAKAVAGLLWAHRLLRIGVEPQA